MVIFESLAKQVYVQSLKFWKTLAKISNEFVKVSRVADWHFPIFPFLGDFVYPENQQWNVTCMNSAPYCPKNGCNSGQCSKSNARCSKTNQVALLVYKEKDQSINSS